MIPTISAQPIVLQTICQINYSPRESTEGWDGKWFGRFLIALGSDYEMEPVVIPGNAALQMLYRHKNQRYFVHLSPGTVVITHAAPYEGWESFEHYVKNVWLHLCSVVNPAIISRVGIRYLNRIPRVDSRETVGDWLRSTDLIPSRIIAQTSKFYFRSELAEDEKTKLCLCIAEEQLNIPVLPIILDLDAISQKNIPADLKSLVPVLNQLHGTLRVEFAHSITAKYKNYLQSPTLQPSSN